MSSYQRRDHKFRYIVFGIISVELLAIGFLLGKVSDMGTIQNLREQCSVSNINLKN